MRFCLHLIGALMSKMKRFYMSDAAKLMDREFGYQADMPPDHKEYRYEERDDAYALRCWCNGREIADKGDIDTRPAWLIDIVNIAKVGGHMAIVKFPPPACIVWFETDANNKLESFKDMDTR